MTHQSTHCISSRKMPKQARSTALVEAILEAAVQVLAEEGARRFTTARVAEKAGVSVGSLYQYFPNKAAILFRLQSDEWRRTNRQWEAILGNAMSPPLERLRSLILAFLRSEVEEAALRVALDDAAPLYRHSPELYEIEAEGDLIVSRFMSEVLPTATEATRHLVGDVIATTLTAVGSEFSETPRSDPEIAVYSDAIADMLCAYLERMAHRQSGQEASPTDQRAGGGIQLQKG